jgi:hypothetical protein
MPVGEDGDQASLRMCMLLSPAELDRLIGFIPKQRGIAAPPNK